jgi:transposase-like protein
VSADITVKERELERQIREMHRGDEILRKASAYFGQSELDRSFKR